MAIPAAGAIFQAINLARQGTQAGGQGNAAGAIAGAGGALASLARAASTTMQSVTGLASALTGGLLAPLDSVRQLVDTIGKLVELADPSQMMQFTLAMNDTMAVIGHALIPVMQAVTTYTRQYGDALAKLMPVLEPLFDAFAEVITGLATNMIPVIEAFAPFLQMVADIVADLMREWGKGIAFLQGVMVEFLNTIAAAFGLTSRFNPDKTSRGAAHRPGEVAGVAETAAKLFRESAAKAIHYGEGDEKKKDATSYLDEIAKAMATGHAVVAQIAEDIKPIANWIRNKLGMGAEAAGAAVNIANNPVGTAINIARNPLGAADELRRWALK